MMLSQLSCLWKFTLLLLLLTECFTMKVAVIGTTGRLGREAVMLLSSKGIEAQCLLRHTVDSAVSPSIAEDATPSQVATFLAALPGVTMIQGDATNLESCRSLIHGCDAVLALHGPVKPPPLQSLFCLLPESDPKHSRSVNYVAIENLIEAAKESNTCKRIVRVTGKGEQPFAFFTILINMFGNMAKAWNYEGEQLLRASDVDYTIIRPGIMRSKAISGKVLALVDNGQDLPVSAVSYLQIAGLCMQSLFYPNTARSTLTAMNVMLGKGEETYAPLLAKVASDTRVFPSDLLQEHRRGAQLGATMLVTFLAVLLCIAIAMPQSLGVL